MGVAGTPSSPASPNSLLLLSDQAKWRVGLKHLPAPKDMIGNAGGADVVGAGDGDVANEISLFREMALWISWRRSACRSAAVKCGICQSGVHVGIKRSDQSGDPRDHLLDRARGLRKFWGRPERIGLTTAIFIAHSFSFSKKADAQFRRLKPDRLIL
jgi:hypothetical protein